jgi:hypothetical protein
VSVLHYSLARTDQIYRLDNQAAHDLRPISIASSDSDSSLGDSKDRSSMAPWTTFRSHDANSNDKPEQSIFASLLSAGVFSEAKYHFNQRVCLLCNQRITGRDLAKKLYVLDSCKHLFHEDCFDTYWYAPSASIHNVCPRCRRHVSTWSTFNYWGLVYEYGILASQLLLIAQH